MRRQTWPSDPARQRNALREHCEASRLECGTVASVSPAASQLSPGGTVEVKVGIQHVSREIVVESSDSASDVEKELMSSIGAGGDGVFTLSDERGRKVLIPVSKIAYVDLGEENARHVGFGAV
jgi:hypothetical protein